MTTSKHSHWWHGYGWHWRCHRWRWNYHRWRAGSQVLGKVGSWHESVFDEWTDVYIQVVNSSFQCQHYLSDIALPINQSINRSVKSIIYKMPLKQSSQRGFDNDGHKPRRPQTMTMMATTMKATNMFSERWYECGLPWIWRFPKSTPLVYHVFIAVAVMVCGRHGLWPSWFVAVMV